MSEPKFTPGPWKADIRTGVYAVYPESEDHNCLSMTDLGTRWMVAYQMGRENRDNWPYPAVSDEQEANARLIAQAPTMFKLLQQVYVLNQGDYWLPGEVNAEIFRTLQCVEGIQ